MVNHLCCVRAAVASPGRELQEGAHRVRISPATGRLWDRRNTTYCMVRSVVCQPSDSRQRPISSLVCSPAKGRRPRTTWSSTFGRRWATSGRSRTPSCTPSRPGWRPWVWSSRRARRKADGDASSRSRRPGASALDGWLDRPSGASTELRDLGLLQLFFADLASDRGAAASCRAATRDPPRQARRLPGGRASSDGPVRPRRGQRTVEHWRGETLRMGLLYEEAAVEFWTGVVAKAKARAAADRT